MRGANALLTVQFSGLVSYANILCPHLRYECGSTSVRFSVWRGLLELLQIFQDTKTDVRKNWDRRIINGFIGFDESASRRRSTRDQARRSRLQEKILTEHNSAMFLHLSFVTGGTICFTLKVDGNAAPMHLEPLDLKVCRISGAPESKKICGNIYYQLNCN